MVTWQERARALADDLAALGALDPAWREAFEQVPRHVFVPRFYRLDGILVDGTDPDMRGQWLDEVYRDDSLTTQRLAEPGSGRMVPTSSSTVSIRSSRPVVVGPGCTVDLVGLGRAA